MSEIKIEEFNSFMDNTWGLSPASDIIQFEDCLIPLNQEKCLTLFDFLCIPWDWSKQEWGYELEVIGHWIDCKKMVISLAYKKKTSVRYRTRHV